MLKNKYWGIIFTGDFVFGYKSFNADMTNRYGMKFEVGKIYTVPGPIKFGNNGNGFHMCKNMEDTFRYFDSTNIAVCEVNGFGKNQKYEDEYYGFYDMYAVEKIEILKLLKRKEILEYMLELYPERVVRFIQLFKLYDDEIKLFEEKFRNESSVIKYIDYYQKGKCDVWTK